MNLKDECQTPGYAIEPLMKANLLPQYTRDSINIWEPAAGEGILVRSIRMIGYKCFGTDLKTGEDFLTIPPPTHFDAIITNPPFSIKIDFVKRCIETGNPWALLMESNTISLKSFHKLIIPLAPEIGIIWFSPRVNFKMPNKKWAGTSHFPVAWFCWNFGFTGNMYLIMEHWSKEYRKTFEI